MSEPRYTTRGVKDAKALLYAVLADPFDDEPRLIAADWLEEQGNEPDTLRAELIRLGCRMKELCSEPPLKLEEYLLHKRARVILTPDRFWDWYSAGWKAAFPARFILPIYPQYRVDSPLNAQLPWSFVIDRGFLGRVELPHHAWLQWGPRIATWNPVTEVRLQDLDYTDLRWTESGSLQSVGFALFSYLKGGTKHGTPQLGQSLTRWYDTPSEAAADLSQACVNWARDQVGLPLLDME